MAKQKENNVFSDDLSNCINIGRDTEFKLKQVGITTCSELKRVGSEQAFIRLQTIDPGACLSLLYGLDGAVEGIKWNLISQERKLELQQFFKMVKK